MSVVILLFGRLPQGFICCVLFIARHCGVNCNCRGPRSSTPCFRSFLSSLSRFRVFPQTLRSYWRFYSMSVNELTTVLDPRPLATFVETKYIRGVTERAIGYVKAGFPVHFRGPSGTGKTNLAMPPAPLIGRPGII